MTKLIKALESIVNGTNNLCCLCFNICDDQDLVCGKDEASIVLNNKYENIIVSDLITSTLGNDFTHYVETMENICEPCTKSLITSYTFKQTCHLNAMLLSKALNGLNTGFQNTTKPEKEKSLLVSLSLENFSSQFLYDNENIFNPKMALDRFMILNTPKPKEPPKLNEKTNKCGIKDSDMLHDPSNHHIFQCKVCLKMYRSMLSLRNHYTRVHINKNHTNKPSRMYRTKVFTPKSVSRKGTSCAECGNVFNDLNSLKMHRMSHKMTTIVCPDCGRTYKNEITYRNHLQLNICMQERRHSPSQAKYTCDYCNKKYTQKVSLRVHIQFEHGNYKAHICEWCGKKFWAQSRLKAHIVKHTRERNFTCPICQGKFVTKESLLYHTRLHTGEKPYKCPECSSQFLSASRRSDHIKRYHHGAKAGLECDVCHGKFRSGDVLLKHKRTHDEKLIKKAEIYPKKKMNTKIHVIKITENKNIETNTNEYDKYIDLCKYNV